MNFTVNLVKSVPIFINGGFSLKNKNKTVWLSALAIIALILCPVTAWGQTLPTNPGLYKLDNNIYVQVTNVAANNLAAAVTHANGQSGNFTLLINQNISASRVSLSGNLTIIGIGAERTIQYNGTTIEHSLISIGDNNGILTIGNNITLKGAPSGTPSNYVVHVSSGTFIMEEGSKITGNFTGSPVINLFDTAADLAKFKLGNFYGSTTSSVNEPISNSRMLTIAG